MAEEDTKRCLNEVVAAGQGAMKPDDAQGVLGLVDERAERLARERGLSGPEAARMAGAQLADRDAALAALERANRLRNLAIRTGRLERIETVARQVGGDETPDFAHAMANQVVAKNAVADGARASAEAQAVTRRKKDISALALGLEKAGLLKTFRNGKLEREWGLELFELSRAAAGDKAAQPGITGSAPARAIAEVVHAVQEASRQRLNALGADIGAYSGYITRTVHDMDKIRGAGRDEWIAFVLPRLADDVFEGEEGPRGAFLNENYNALSTGAHFGDVMVGLNDAAFTGPANLAAKLSESRQLRFRDGASWLDYQKRFGSGTLAEQTTLAIERAGRDEALLSRWGTNPEAEFKADFRRLEEKFRATNQDEVAALRRAELSITRRFQELTGEANRPASAMWAQIASGARAAIDMAKLGLVAFTHLSVLPSKAAELRYHGAGLFESYLNSIDALFTGRGRGETRALSDALGAGFEGAGDYLRSRFHSDDAVPGTMSKLANRFFTLSGLSYLVNAEKAGTMRLMARVLGRQIGNGFEQLPPELRRGLTLYDISPAEWDMLRQAPDHITVDGRAHLTPDAALRGPGDLDAAARDRLALKLHSYYADVADRAVVTPGIEERAMFRAGAPGSIPGEVTHFLMMYKTWGAAMVRQQLGRELYGGQDLGGKVAGILHLAVATTLTGMATIALKALFKGQTPPDWRDPRTWSAALIQGGGMGILGDYLFGEASRVGSTPVESLAGPAATTVAEILDLIQRARGVATGDPNLRPKDLLPEAVKVLKNNTPFLNLFFLRKTLDYLLFDSLSETLNPGYLHRAAQGMRKRTGQSYLAAHVPVLGDINLSPENHLHTFGR